MTFTFIEKPSPNSGKRKAVKGTVQIRHVIVHYTGMPSCDQALRRLCDKNSGVSAHYLIDEDGSTFRMVPEALRAWHAGVGFWNGVRDLNSTSIGIELVNPGHEHGYQSFPCAQLEAFTELVREIMERHSIKPDHVLGHSDIAPGRKIDPGELFPWRDLATQGIGVWPKKARPLKVMPSITATLNHLATIGYAVPLSVAQGADVLKSENGDTDVISAFQRRYRPTRFDGILDTETAGIIASLAFS